MHDPYLLKPKGLYFSLFMFYYFSFIFRSKYLTKELGLNDQQLGLSSAICYAIGALGSILWTSLANKTGWHRQLSIANTILACLIFFSLRLISPETAESDPEGFLASVLAVLVAFQLMISGLIPLLDAQVLSYLDLVLQQDMQSDSDWARIKKQSYGRQRMFGTLGFGVVTLSVGAVYDKCGSDALFYICGACSVLLVTVQSSLALKPKRNKKKKKNESSEMQLTSVKVAEDNNEMKNVVVDDHDDDSNDNNEDDNSLDSNECNAKVSSWQRFKELLKCRPYVKVLVCIICYGLISGATGYFSLFLDRHVKVSNFMVSIGTAILLVSEAGLFFISDRIMDFMQSPGRMLVVGTFCASLRLVLYAWVPDDCSQLWIIGFWILEPLQGLAYVCIQIAVIRVIIENVSTSSRTTAIGLAFTTRTICSGISSGIGGYISDNYGLQNLFRVAFYFGMLVTLIMTLVLRNK